LSKSLNGKGVSLAFFLLFLNLPLFSQDFPVIIRLDPGDIGFKQYINDVEGNRKRVFNTRSRLPPEVIAQYLTIYQYTTRQEDNIFSLSARLNMPYSALASLNGLDTPSSLETGKILLLPSCPGIFVPSVLQTDLEKITGAVRQNSQGGIEIKIRSLGKQETFLFFPGADFTPTERAFFLNSGFRFPLRQYRVTSPYGMRKDPFSDRISMHQGIDLAAPEGTEVIAVADGVVTAVDFDPIYGNYIIISHKNNWTSLYGHLQSTETVLRTDVKSGNLIGRVGSTGQSTGPHLHFELRQDGKAFDPAGKLRP